MSTEIHHCKPYAYFVECFEELDAGTGELAEDAYYYDPNENRCFFFWYAGAGGNANRYVENYLKL